MSQNQEQYRFWQHPNGTIYIVWNEEYLSAEDKPRLQTRRISTGTSDWKVAEEYRAKYITGLKNSAPEEPTIEYLLDRYRNEHGTTTRSLRTIDDHIKTLKPFFFALQPSHITNSLLKDYAKQRQASNGTILRELGTLKAALNYAQGNRWIPKQPDFIMPVSAPPPRDIWLTRDQVATLIEKAKSHHISLFIKLAVSTAARSGAILELTWERIDFERRMIDFGHGWGNKRRSVVPMNDAVYEALITAKELAQTNFVIEYKSQRVHSIKKAFRMLSKDCGIKAFPHALRHTAATWMVMDGVPLSEVARLLGDSEKTVEKVYGKHAPDYLRRAVKSLDFGRKNNAALQL